MMLDPEEYPLKEEMAIAEADELVIEVSISVKYAEEKTVKRGRVLDGIVDCNGTPHSVWTSFLGSSSSERIVPGVEISTKVLERRIGSTGFVDKIVSVKVHRTACPVTLLISELYDYQVLRGDRNETQRARSSILVTG